MHYSKPPLSFKEQANLLLSRGLIVKSPDDLEGFLKYVNYYRLSGYWYVYKQIDPHNGTESFLPGTTFEKIRDRYEFDRKLRLLLMDAVERIEVAIFRTRMVEVHTIRYGPFGYANFDSYAPNFTLDQFASLMREITEDENRSKEEFIRRYREKYSSEKYLPFWMVAELMSFGQLLTIYRFQELSIKQIISHEFDLYPMVLDSWLLTLNYIRNSCAHHARLWNRPLPLPVKLPLRKNDRRWYEPVVLPNHTIYTIVTTLQYLMNYIIPANQWKSQIQQLISDYPDIPIQQMGFPIDWLVHPLWN